MNYFMRVLPYLRPYWHLSVVSAIFTILGVLAGLLEPWPLKILVDSVLGDVPLSPLLARVFGPLAGRRFTLLIFAVATAVGVRLLDNLLKVSNSYVQTKLEQNMVLDFRGDLFQHAQRLSLAYHDRRQTGQLMYAINNQGNAAAGLMMTLLPLLQSSLMLIGMIWITFQIDHQLALVALVVVPLLYYCVGYYTTHIQPQLQQVMGMEGETLSIVYEAIGMMRVIVAFGREGYEFQRFREQGEEAVGERVKLTVRQTFFSLTVNMIIAIGTALVMGIGAYQALQNRLTVGQLLVILSYIAAVYKPLESISGTIGFLQQRFVALRIAFDLLDTEPEIVDRPSAVKIGRCRGRITFDGVYFHYSQRAKTLRNISFEARPGELIGIVGPTGAGKSTLVSLIPRFYDPQHGRVLLDGRDMRDITVRSLREQISMVLQEPLLFSGTIADNIHYGRLDARREEIIQAAKAANAHDFIMELPHKYETHVGERGAQLSGGERQRICVARAFLRDAPILILDEPTSSVDSKTEAVILDALGRLMVGRTTFMIAHRLSTLRNIDTILVINNGALIELGTHDELMAQDGLYRRFYQMQHSAARHPAAQRPSLSIAPAPARRAPENNSNGRRGIEEAIRGFYSFTDILVKRRAALHGRSTPGDSASGREQHRRGTRPDSDESKRNGGGK